MRTAFGLLLLLSLVACGPQLPKLPEIDFAPFPPGVRAAVEKAHSDAEFAPGDAIRTVELAKVLHAHNLLDAAIVYYKHARQLAPEEGAYAHLLGVALTERGNYPEAIESLHKALALQPSEATRFALARAQLAAGSTVEAGAAYRALGDHPVALYGLGQTLQGAEKLAALQKAVAREPRYGAAWKALAELYRTVGEKDKAAEADRAYARYRLFEPGTGDGEVAAVRELNQSAAGLRQRAQRAEAESRLLDAAKLYEQVAAANPTDDAVAAALVGVYVRLKDHMSAEKTYQAARLRNPESGALAAANGLLLNATQRRAEAKPFFEKAVAADAMQAEAWYQLGLFAEAEGAAQRAVDCYGKALFADPAHRAARYQAAMILSRHGKVAEAREQLEMAARGPDEELTARARQALAALPQR